MANWIKRYPSNRVTAGSVVGAGVHSWYRYRCGAIINQTLQLTQLAERSQLSQQIPVAR